MKLSWMTNGLGSMLLVLCGCATQSSDRLNASEDVPDFGAPSTAMKPAGMTSEEKVGKADGNDPRDQYPGYYGFTAAPTSPGQVAGEFEQAEELLLAWGSGAWELERFFMNLIAAAAGRIDITIVAPDEATRTALNQDMRQLGINTNLVNILVGPVDTIWMRDFGPLVTRDNGNYRVVDPRYYWGRWYDDLLPTLLASYWQESVSRPPIEMEGGNFLSDGAGRCITSDMVLRQNAASRYTEADVQRIFRQYYGCQQTTILPQLVNEGTGHVDMFSHITGPGQILVGQYDHAVDPYNGPGLDSAAAKLVAAGFEVTRIPMPSNEGLRLWRTYTNALAVNDVVMVPVYTEDARFQTEALAIFQKAYPGKTILPINSDDIIYWSGAIHCVTMTR